MDNPLKQDPNSVVAIFGEHSAAENAIKELKTSGFDVKKLSIIGQDYRSQDNVVGFYNTGDRMKYWGKFGAFWGGLWGLLFGAAFPVHTRCRPGRRSRICGCMDYRGPGGSSRRRRCERFGGRFVQPRHSEGQRREVREFD